VRIQVSVAVAAPLVADVNKFLSGHTVLRLRHDNDDHPERVTQGLRVTLI
jgi:hypothetical protein